MAGSRSRPGGVVRGWVAAVLLALSPVGAAAALAEGMPIADGDVLRVMITGAPDLGRDTAQVGVDGRIVLPGLDAIEVAGSDVDAARDKIAAALVEHQILKDPAVLVEVVSYRPLYVGGAVQAPGAVPYEPGLTVRHALILAGGLDRSEGTQKLTQVGLVELKTKYQASNSALVEVKSRIARLRAELNELAAPDFSSVGEALAPEKAERSIVTLDTDLFKEDMAAWTADQAHLRDIVALIDFEIDVLDRQASLQQQEFVLQNDQVKSARTLVEKGVMPLPRLQELEREASRLSRDLLDNQAYMARAKQNRQSNLYQVGSAETKRRIELTAALRDALLDQTQIEAENEVISAALIAAGIGLIDASLGDDLQPRVVINRTTQEKTESVTADMDTLLLPGDVIEVSIVSPQQG
jgi:protein involved in polysaccharide export with SLBB domain